MDEDELKLCGEVGKDARAFVRKYMQLRAYADELNARCVADAADAERYRWLRQDEGTADWDAAGVLELYAGPDYSRKSGESLDTATDETMAPKRDVLGPNVRTVGRLRGPQPVRCEICQWRGRRLKPRSAPCPACGSRVEYV